MPLYEYKCQKCGAVFELLQKVNDPLLHGCIQCGGAVNKLLSPPALQFKGSGWYVTDYASKGSHASESKPKEETKKDTPDSTPKKEGDDSTPEK